MRSKIKILAIAVILLSLATTSCWYSRNWEDLHPLPPVPLVCNDTLGIVMSYSAHIAPIIQANCSINNLVCHKSGPSAGGSLATHAGVAVFCGGSPSPILEALHHTGPFPMPRGQPKLPACEIAKFDKWVMNGFPNN